MPLRLRSGVGKIDRVVPSMVNKFAGLIAQLAHETRYGAKR
jgi:hypothetical protein